MRTTIKHVDIDISTGRIIDAANPPYTDTIIYRITLQGTVFQRADALTGILRETPTNRSTMARLIGQEQPHGFGYSPDAGR